jgi:hypothetical protein
MKLKEVEEKYRDEWVLVEILKEDESGEPTEIKVIANSLSSYYHSMPRQ